jgi:hypothetical protein
MNEFDAACFLAARLLELPAIAEWVSLAHPIAIVDEAQDLGEHRFAMLRALDMKCQMLAAADDFQCLDPRQISSVQNVIQWLRKAEEVTSLTDVVRTAQTGILRTALALREGRCILDQLGTPDSSFNTTRTATGFRLIETTAKNSGQPAWSIGNELRQMTGQVAILTPDGSHQLTREALEKVRTKNYPLNKARGTSFGPFHRLEWESGDEERASIIIGKLELAETMSCSEAISALAVCAGDMEVIETTKRLGRLRRVTGRQTVSATEIEGLIRAATRDISRHGRVHVSSIAAMTIHAAKNREFENVLVLWPHTAPAHPDQARRLLYNAITRAQRRCSLIVFGKDRLDHAPFS